MTDIHQFDEIRPYTNEEVQEVISRIVRERGFLNFCKIFFPEQSTKSIITDLLNCKNIFEFQKHLVYTIVQRVIQASVSKLTFSGFENIQKGKAYIFMSNHRDIVLDSALLQYILVTNSYPTTEIAIGSNLLILNWIVDLVKLNRSFIVKRDVPKLELYHYSILLSKYIRFTVAEQSNSIWIAQREGRTKDGNDSTQLSVLKMLNLSGSKDVYENFKELNIIPFSISYEFEPLAVSKVQELYNKKINPEYKKDKLDDLTSMSEGMQTSKGHVHYAFGKPINLSLQNYSHVTDRKEKFDILSKLITDEIHKNYYLTANNYIAADLFFKTNEYNKFYTPKDVERFNEYCNKSISQIKGEKEIIEEMFLKIYAMPVKNKFSVVE